MAGDITSVGHNILRDKTSWRTKHPEGQNVQKTKHPWGQMSVGKKCLEEQNVWRQNILLAYFQYTYEYILKTSITILKWITFKINYLYTRSKKNLVVTLFRIARAGIFPRSSLLGAGQSGFWEFGEGGSVGWRVGQMGSVYKQPEREVDDSCHNWRVPSK